MAKPGLAGFSGVKIAPAAMLSESRARHARQNGAEDFIELGRNSSNLGSRSGRETAQR